MSKTDTETQFAAINSRILACERCPRLRAWCQEVAEKKRKSFQDWDYWGKPVPNFGDPKARFVIVGLAPAAHGANRTGRMFTGDRSGDFLYAALHREGFASQAEATSADDGLVLRDCVITAAAHCAPPANKPTTEEVRNCESHLKETLETLKPSVLLALGGLAWKAIRDFYREEAKISPAPAFGHGMEWAPSPNVTVLGSYHVSQQNTFTGRLTEAMFDSVLRRVRELLA